MQVTNYRAKAELTGSNPPAGKDILVATGTENTTVIKSFEVMAGTESAIVEVFRKDDKGNVYGAIRLNLTAYNYVMLWEGFVALPAGHSLYINADSVQVEAVCNAVEL